MEWRLARIVEVVKLHCANVREPFSYGSRADLHQPAAPGWLA